VLKERASKLTLFEDITTLKRDVSSCFVFMGSEHEIKPEEKIATSTNVKIRNNRNFTAMIK
jgi:hypothetical protein